ncbi:hypothetical protein HBH56_154860 [Parastagonospora nodorum]|uniref:FAD-binding PCMH-type domain-containing protein n=2 Tax=Phaeosphaeria nodorum (strain SN15 / ATCC MYA-4574 / FGSC 10173) TaxID=321614 RepID=A0A7U2HZA9_PHANO|nr:hypothetical protein SNOG_05547 [Parastagonospora nodorum SN15]KAH3909980.1 hypothetical protein HBH56_154860 [Parastagonospora nodorum]EAT86611.1 hypothetical protein SNOG_05547 [Parastagonospora nodorum SN15]KAH3926539.1 hypothetical protein HBH54_162830 [Parastagonospora nodorum]KAH3970421.1 hypothetical protein HBH52_168030 [Parastagonospora nodorum]KAH3971980.1 hypothetical protein HBH51_105180 [Parastagonospora nodorum]
MGFLFSYALLLSSAVNAAVLRPKDISACQAIANAGVNVWFDPPNTSTSNYDLEQALYWSNACSALRPGCIVTPSTLEEVSTVVKTLKESNSRFAIKSGGHNPNPDWSSLSDGPIISTRNFNEVAYDKQTNTVRVGSGNRWGRVVETLEPLGVTVAGGRVGNVGVGGYLLGGGLGFLSTQYGWAASGIVGAEMVLPNSTIVKISNESHPDLMLALKGGGSPFGIVTTFIVRARPMDRIWGGTLIYSNVTDTAPILSAIASFTRNYEQHPKAAVEPNVLYNSTDDTVSWLIYVFYDGPDNQGVFDEFLSLKPTINLATVRLYSDFLNANSQTQIPGLVAQIGTVATPLPYEEHTLEVHQSYIETWLSEVRAIKHIPNFWSLMPTQPIPKLLSRKAREEGGDLLDLDDDVDRVILAVVMTYPSSTVDQQTDAAMKSIISKIEDSVANFTANGLLPETHLPVFMNDQYYSQDYFGSLKPNMRQLAQRVQKEVDSDGFFAKNTGGPKVL